MNYNIDIVNLSNNYCKKFKDILKIFLLFDDKYFNNV